MLQIDQNLCTACGLCAQHCTEEVITLDTESRPAIGDRRHCLGCRHCEAGCPAGAISHDGFLGDAIMRVGAIKGNDMAHFLSAKRSCRHFENRPVEREKLERLVHVARMAPSAKNCEEREFIVVTDKGRLSRLRMELVANNRKIHRLLKIVTSRPLSWLVPGETIAALRRIINSFGHMLTHESVGKDTIFYNAPAIIMIGGIAQDPFGKDNALASQHYLMMQAEAMGLGSCIMGYAQAAPKILARHVKVPRFYRIYGVVAVGYPAYRYQRVVNRKPASITWQ